MPRLRNISALGLVLTAIAATAVACGDDSSSGDDKTTGSSSSNSKTLAVVYTDYPPFVSTPSSGDKSKPEGLAVDIAQAIGDKLGWKVTFNTDAFANFVPDIQSGKYDMTIGGSYDTPEREEVVDIVDYMFDGESILALKGNPKGLAQDNLCGMKMMATAGTTYVTQELPAESKKCTDAGNPAIDVLSAPDNGSAVTALQAGRTDGVISSAITNAYIASQSNDAFEVVGDPYNQVRIGLLMQKGSEMPKQVQGALQELLEDGTYQKILDKWNVGNLAADCILMNNDESSCKSGS